MSLNLSVFPDKNDPSPLVIYHGRSCPDGFAAALAAWLYFDGHAEFLALDHGDVKTLADLPPVAGRAVYILDFSFSEPLLRDIDAVAAKLVVLDHHLSAADKLGDFQCQHGVVHFEMNKSGAHLAWEFFHPMQPLPDLVKYVEDRDIWVWQYPESAGFLAALDMEVFDFARWQAIAGLQGEALRAYIERGRAMDEKFVKLAHNMVDSAQQLTFNGVVGLMVNVPSAFHSLVGDILCEKSGTFALMWSLDKTGVIKCGLRSRTGFNCIPLAESMHGGGHAQACGFKMPRERLLELLGGHFTA
jgi:uncharacterized protein